MTDARSMFRIRVLAAISAIVMLVVALFGFGAVKADSAGNGESAPSDPGLKRELYYFSDYEGSQSFAAGLDVDGGLDKVELYYCDQGTMYIDFINLHLDLGTFNDISDSYIIMEMRQGFSFQIDDGANSDELLPNKLKSIFAELKNCGCKIMFVCGTDESRFAGYTDFLEYVDIHVNTDLLNIFIQNIFVRAVSDGGSSQTEGKLKDCTIIFDQSIAYGVDSSEIVSSWFLRTYFIPLIRFGYYEELYGTNFTVAEVMEANNISVLCNLSGNSCYDVFEQVTVDFDYNCDKYFYGRNVYAVGTSWYGDVYAYGWIQDVLYLRGNYEGCYNKLSVYIYDSDGYNLDEYCGSGIYTTTGASISLIYDVMVAFINDEDLHAYNNYNGRCVVSYKPVPVGSDGWMILFGLDEGLTLPCWQIIMDENDAAYYLSGSGIF